MKSRPVGVTYDRSNNDDDDDNNNNINTKDNVYGAATCQWGGANENKCTLSHPNNFLQSHGYGR